MPDSPHIPSEAQPPADVLAQQSTVQQPTAQQPTAPQPTVAQPTVAQPTAAQPFAAPMTSTTAAPVATDTSAKKRNLGPLVGALVVGAVLGGASGAGVAT